ncbi:Asp-tRNA(Asn)/Glu-tRNA(Gln) amidotransferase GatCAB subunit C [Leptospira perolatii]|uniref:Aspartyl/glutamyl-tRNA(Asn/Gln) amidotransferase subunit C n=1 Tax=Leptospira perolatii TaxID=2023191 RepID=A0A2M9ZQN8_9LEPT|nr:Asp-tRNA(Asn)/Glu-tRNA(Gln) amidotransferase subunit GatC [Leptospira perolatii]PJZ70560.1 Asp-tRNA(Asn)/Glu-tRNA(Gln) amidotransferase GatCAB subunit C [Leptospira perolatii]PJZ74396.1 Asp-tRNA(Asn)/Glu-tRNA(Gln) amidotransferase GatCAB subunit C [Leptospira perolatii]
MNLNEDSLNKIAELARLKISKEEVGSFLGDFNKVLNYVDTIKELDVSSISEDDLIPNHENSFRPDAIQEGLTRKEIESFAPTFQNGYFIVPKVIET